MKSTISTKINMGSSILFYKFFISSAIDSHMEDSSFKKLDSVHME